MSGGSELQTDGVRRVNQRLHEGDRVEVIEGGLRGRRGVVQSVAAFGRKAFVILDDISPGVWLPSRQLQPEPEAPTTDAG